MCSSLVPYFAHGEPQDLNSSNNWAGSRLRPCRSFCQSVEQRCPYLLPGDRAPAYPTQYAGEPTFLCRGNSLVVDDDPPVLYHHLLTACRPSPSIEPRTTSHKGNSIFGTLLILFKVVRPNGRFRKADNPATKRVAGSKEDARRGACKRK